MAEVKVKKKIKVLKILGVIAAVIVLVNLAGFAVNSLFFSGELDKISPYGKMTDINGGKMHVYSMGNGGKTIVLLPGFGVPLPSADFGPLIRKFSAKYTVVCVEYFGTGFSGQTDTARTNENYVNEIRTALKLNGFKPPYILMPHSASGIYSEYYAAKYPREVSAVIMLDTTSTGEKVSGNPPKFIFTIGKIQQATGLTRLIYGLIPAFHKKENGYTEKEISDYKTFVFHTLNDTIINQSLSMADNINEVNASFFPAEVPVLKIVSSDTYKKIGTEYQDKHMKRLGKAADLKVLEGTHFIYQTAAGSIFSVADEFIGRLVER